MLTYQSSRHHYVEDGNGYFNSTVALTLSLFEALVIFTHLVGRDINIFCIASVQRLKSTSIIRRMG